MNTFAPSRLGISAATIFGPRISDLGVTIRLTFQLSSPRSWLVATQADHQVQQALGTDSAVDYGYPKMGAEALVWASVRREHPITEATVRFRCATIDKQLDISGERIWEPGPLGWRRSKPLPFTVVSLDWTETWGGSGVAENPAGHGVDAMALLRRPGPVSLPRITYPGMAPTRPDEATKPASLQPLHLGWKSSKDAGTFDQRWLTHRSPAYPIDMAPDYFNVAPSDQRLPHPFRGDEEVYLEGHRDLPLSLRLPGVATRCVYRRKGTHEIEEARTVADTLCLFPDSDLGMLLFRAVIPAAGVDGTSLDALIVAAEWMESPRTTGQYREALDKRLDPRSAADYAFYDEDLLPEIREGREHASARGAAEERAAGERVARENKDRARALRAKIGATFAASGLASLAELSAEILRDADSATPDVGGGNDTNRGSPTESMIQAGVGRLEALDGTSIAETIAQFREGAPTPEELAQSTGAGIEAVRLQLNKAKQRREVLEESMLSKRILTDPEPEEPNAAIVGLVDSYVENVRSGSLGPIHALDELLNAAFADADPSMMEAARAAGVFSPAPTQLEASFDEQFATAVREQRTAGENPFAALDAAASKYDEVGSADMRQRLEDEAHRVSSATWDALVLERGQRGVQAVRYPTGIDLAGFHSAMGDPSLSDDIVQRFRALNVSDPRVAFSDVPEVTSILDRIDSIYGDDAGNGMGLLFSAMEGSSGLESFSATFLRAFGRRLGIPVPQSDAVFDSAGGTAAWLNDYADTWTSGKTIGVDEETSKAFSALDKLYSRVVSGLPVEDVKALAEAQANFPANSAAELRTSLAKLREQQDLDVGAPATDIADQIQQIIDAAEAKEKALIGQSAAFASAHAARLVNTQSQSAPADVKPWDDRVPLEALEETRWRDHASFDVEQLLKDPEALRQQQRITDVRARLVAPALIANVGLTAHASKALGDMARAAWRDGKSLSGAPLVGVDWEAADLRNIDLRGAQLEGANLRRADLRGAMLDYAVLTAADLSEARLDDATLIGANLSYTLLNGTSFVAADMANVKLAHAAGISPRFDNAKLDSVTAQHAVFEGPSFHGSTCTSIQWIEAGLRGGDFRHASWFDATFTNTLLDGADFSSSNLMSVLCTGGSANGVLLEYAKLNRAMFADVSMVGMQALRVKGEHNLWLRVNLTSAVLNGAELSFCGFDESFLLHADLTDATLKGSSFCKSDLSGASLVRAQMHGAALRATSGKAICAMGANLYGVDLVECDLPAADWTRASLDKTLLSVRIPPEVMVWGRGREPWNPLLDNPVSSHLSLEQEVRGWLTVKWAETNSLRGSWKGEPLSAFPNVSSAEWNSTPRPNSDNVIIDGTASGELRLADGTVAAFFTRYLFDRISSGFLEIYFDWRMSQSS